MSDWIVDVLSFQKIFSLCGLKGHIVEIRGGVTLVDDRRTTNNEQRRNVKIELEFWEAEFAMMRSDEKRREMMRKMRNNEKR